MKIFRSVRFNIFLGCLIALGSAVGTFLPQIPDAAEKVTAYQVAHPDLHRLFDFFGLFDLYHTWWFMGLLGLMAFDIVVCKLWNKPPDPGIVALPPEMTREAEIEKHLSQKEAALKLKPYQAVLSSALAPAAASQMSKSFLEGEGYHLRPEVSGAAGSSFIATRHRLQRWGSYTAHIALVVILLGALIKGVYGFVEMVPVLEGRSRAMQNKPDWEVYVDKFTIKYYDGTFEPKSFSSVLRVQKGSQVLGEKTIIVNDPLDISGVRFYQASWGAGGMFRSVDLKLGSQILQLPQRTPEKIPGTPFLVTADVMLPNFTVNNGQADSASLDLQNPAVRFTFSVGPHKTSPLWLLKNDPSVCFAEDPDGNLTRAPKPPFSLAAIDPILFSGIQVAYDPGFKVVLTGAVLWLLGMIGTFYLHRRRLWVLVEPAEAGAKVSVGAWSSRGPEEFTKDFDGLMHRLRAQLDARDDFRITQNPLVEVS
ncbi:MAG: cytochrome c biogenesis protein ResB [Elusimicrobia bacterium]|nr:cytochrome c biogenesis protein ResB [Elusimicrobiota bacterium]